MTEIIAKSRFVGCAPRKLRAVADLVRNKPSAQAMTILNFTNKKAARILAKTLKTAIYNAVNNFNLDKNHLRIKKVFIDQGPSLKRFIAMSRGSGNQYRKRTSHITIVLESLIPVKATPKPAPATTSKTDPQAKPVKSQKSTKSTKSAEPIKSKTTVTVRSRKAKKTK